MQEGRLAPGFWGPGASPLAVPIVRSIPQALADEMALAASACIVAQRAGRPFLGVPEVTAALSDAEARALIADYQKGYMKEVDRLRDAKVRRSQAIPFTSMPLNYQRALTSRFLAWRAEIPAENPDLAWDTERGYYWAAGHFPEGCTVADQGVEATSRPVRWRGEDTSGMLGEPVVWPRTPLL